MLLIWLRFCCISFLSIHSFIKIRWYIFFFFFFRQYHLASLQSMKVILISYTLNLLWVTWQQQRWHFPWHGYILHDITWRHCRWRDNSNGSRCWARMVPGNLLVWCNGRCSWGNSDWDWVVPGVTIISNGWWWLLAGLIGGSGGGVGVDSTYSESFWAMICTDSFLPELDFIPSKALRF